MVAPSIKPNSINPEASVLRCESLLSHLLIKLAYSINPIILSGGVRPVNIPSLIGAL